MNIIPPLEYADDHPDNRTRYTGYPREHEFEAGSDHCNHCRVPRYAVIDGLVVRACGALNG